MDLDTLFNEAEQHRLSGEYEDAVKKYQQVLQTCPDHVRAHLGLGLVFGFTGEFDGSIVELERAVSLAPENVECRLNLALTYMMLGMYDEGKKELAHVLQLDPDNPKAKEQLLYIREFELMAGEEGVAGQSE